MTTQTYRDPAHLGAHHVGCGGELLLFTDADGNPVQSRKEGCYRAYCDGCGQTGPVAPETALRMNTGVELPKPRLRLDPMDAGRAQLGLAGSRR